jgi:hypothetical protein
MKIFVTSCFGVLIACFQRRAFPFPPLAHRLSNHPFCGAYPGRIFDELRKAKAVRQLLELRRSPLALRTNSLATGDFGNIAVIEDDGTIVSQANTFDLAGTNLRMTPNGPGAYALSFQAGSINQKFGTKLALTDDDFREIAFPTGFQFPSWAANTVVSSSIQTATSRSPGTPPIPIGSKPL